jgi:hypothetical protein
MWHKNWQDSREAAKNAKGNQMDTDDLSDNAYSIIVHAAKVCDTL